MANKVVHFEIMGPDPDALAGFYGNLFDWKTEATPGFEGYNLVSADEAGIGGAVGTGPEQMPTYLTFYIEVDSIDRYLERIEQAGGKTVVPRTVIPGMVTFSQFADPAGNVVGLVETDIQPAE